MKEKKYRICWKMNEGSGAEYKGPALFKNEEKGQVVKVVPKTKKESTKMAQYANRNYKRADHWVEEVTCTPGT